MDRLKVAAHFVAFTCFLNRRAEGGISPQEAGSFARENWKAFLPYVREDLGKFLTSKPKSRPTTLSPMDKHRPGRRADF